MNKQSKRILILGAGPAGLAAAQLLSQHFDVVDIYEKDAVVGGMCKSFEYGESIVDLGPHRFYSQIKEVNDFWTRFAGDELIEVNRQTRIFYRQKFFKYPLSLLDTFAKLGVYFSILSILSFLKAKIKFRTEENFESWTINQFGEYLYDIFFKEYTKKLWGIDGRDLDQSFAQQRIRKLSIVNLLLKKSARSLVEKFHYCRKGTGQIYKNIAADCLKNNSKIYLNSEVSKIDMKEDVTIISKGVEKKYDLVISTIPITLFANMINDKFKPLTKQLKFRNTILVYIEIPNGDYFSDNWIYINSKNTQIGRITNFSNWGAMNANSNNTILCCELWCNDDDELWKIEENILFEVVKRDLSKIRLINTDLIKSFKIKRIKNSYPIYELGYKEKLQKIENELSRYENVYYIGRSGSFQYNNQDHSIYMGLKLAEHIISNGNSSDWKIKFNYSKYLEEEDK